MDAAEPFRNPGVGIDMTGKDGTLRSLCSCSGCPTYNECMRENEELVFCMTGASVTCSFDATTCLCIGCPVAAEFGAGKAFSCIRNSR